MPIDITLILPDKVGSLAHAFRALAARGVVPLGCAGFPAWAGEGILHVLVEDADAARDALHDAGVTIREERELLLTRPLDGEAQIAQVLALVAEVGANVDLIYQLADGGLAIGVNRLEAALRAIGDLAAEPLTA